MKEKSKDTNLITEDGNIRRYVGSDVIDQFNPYQAGYINYPNGYGHGTRVSDIAFTLATSGGQQITKEQDMRIRKLTPNECGKLMGVKKQDRLAIGKQSDASQYHLYGDSIVTSVLMSIFGELFDVDYHERIKVLVNELQDNK